MSLRPIKQDMTALTPTLRSSPPTSKNIQTITPTKITRHENKQKNSYEKTNRHGYVQSKFIVTHHDSCRIKVQCDVFWYFKFEVGSQVVTGNIRLFLFFVIFNYLKKQIRLGQSKIELIKKKMYEVESKNTHSFILIKTHSKILKTKSNFHH